MVSKIARGQEVAVFLKEAEKYGFLIQYKGEDLAGDAQNIMKEIESMWAMPMKTEDKDDLRNSILAHTIP